MLQMGGNFRGWWKWSSTSPEHHFLLWRTSTWKGQEKSSKVPATQHTDARPLLPSGRRYIWTKTTRFQSSFVPIASELSLRTSEPHKVWSPGQNKQQQSTSTMDCILVHTDNNNKWVPPSFSKPPGLVTNKHRNEDSHAQNEAFTRKREAHTCWFSQVLTYKHPPTQIPMLFSNIGNPRN